MATSKCLHLQSVRRCTVPQDYTDLLLLRNSSPPPTASSSATPPRNGPFPAGSYALTTFLDTVSTNCTSNAATWRCYPYTTYSQSSTGAMATFNWVITPADLQSLSSSNYTISSTNNPFAVDFSNVSMLLVDIGLSSERYTFSVPTKKIVIPSAAISRDNSMATCFYNDTTFQADLYTRMSRSYPPPASASSSAATSSSTAGSGDSASEGFKPWPYAIRVEETIGGGSNVPACYKTVNGNLGDRINDGITEEAQKNMCGCLYKNWDP